MDRCIYAKQEEIVKYSNSNSSKAKKGRLNWLDVVFGVEPNKSSAWCILTIDTDFNALRHRRGHAVRCYAQISRHIQTRYSSYFQNFPFPLGDCCLEAKYVKSSARMHTHIPTPSPPHLSWKNRKRKLQTKNWINLILFPWNMIMCETELKLYLPLVPLLIDILLLSSLKMK